MTPAPSGLVPIPYPMFVPQANYPSVPQIYARPPVPCYTGPYFVISMVPQPYVPSHVNGQNLVVQNPPFSKPVVLLNANQGLLNRASSQRTEALGIKPTATLPQNGSSSNINTTATTVSNIISSGIRREGSNSNAPTASMIKPTEPSKLIRERMTTITERPRASSSNSNAPNASLIHTNVSNLTSGTEQKEGSGNNFNASTASLIHTNVSNLSSGTGQKEGSGSNLNAPNISMIKPTEPSRLIRVRLSTITKRPEAPDNNAKAPIASTTKPSEPSKLRHTVSYINIPKGVKEEACGTSTSSTIKPPPGFESFVPQSGQSNEILYAPRPQRVLPPLSSPSPDTPIRPLQQSPNAPSLPKLTITIPETIQDNDNDVPTVEKVCKFYLENRCRYGNRCWNSHPEK